jgi:hypothetical protein
MKIMCEIWFWLCIICVIAHLYFLTFTNYPRQKPEVLRCDDALSLVLNAALAIWLFKVIS